MHVVLVEEREQTQDKTKNEDKKIIVKGDDLRAINIFSYSIGHFMNDLCAACWFFFLSYYLKDIIKIGENNTGIVMLSGQVADAMATPTVGILSDKFNTRIGKRTPWYIGGTILVLITFTLIFIKVIPDDSSEMVTLVYYCACASLFNIGWASVQVSHMSLLPQISLNKRNKDKMNRYRTGFTFLAQTAALCFSFFYFWLIKNKIMQYKILSITCVSVGFITSGLFLFLCRENELVKNIPLYYENMRMSLEKLSSTLQIEDKSNLSNSKEDSNSKETNNVSWTDWLKIADFYIYMLVYMFVRLSINVTQSLIPFYMEYMLNYSKTEEGGTRVEVSIVLLISTIGSILNSIFIQSFIEKQIKNPNNNRIIMIMISAIFVLSGCLPMFFLNENFRYPIFGLAFIFGIGFSQGLSTVSNLINDVVGSKGAQGAFVYGTYSFSDKLSCGIALFLFLPHADNQLLLKYSMPIFPPLSLALAFIIVLIRRLWSNKKEKDNLKERLLKPERNEKLRKSLLDDSRFTFIDNTMHSRKSPKIDIEEQDNDK